jgi:hypothetical protein
MFTFSHRGDLNAGGWKTSGYRFQVSPLEEGYNPSYRTEKRVWADTMYHVPTNYTALLASTPKAALT